MKLSVALIITAWLAVIAGVVHAAPKETADDIKKMVANNTAELVEKFYSEREHFETDPEHFYSEMDQALSKIVDFKRITARVMGKYARKASKSQRAEFLKIFKRSLYETYSKTLIESGEFEIKVTNAAINSRSDKRASVNLEIISDSGNVYPVIYSMYKNKQDEWLMENVIVFGINIGLAFRDRFESTVRSNKGDISAAIANWNVTLDIENQGQEG